MLEKCPTGTIHSAVSHTVIVCSGLTNGQMANFKQFFIPWTSLFGRKDVIVGLWLLLRFL